MQPGKKSRDPQWDEFIRTAGQQDQLIMLLSWRQEEVEMREEGGKREKVWSKIEREGMMQREK